MKLKLNRIKAKPFQSSKCSAIITIKLKPKKRYAVICVHRSLSVHAKIPKEICRNFYQKDKSLSLRRYRQCAIFPDEESPLKNDSKEIQHRRRDKERRKTVVLLYHAGNKRSHRPTDIP